MKNNVHLSIENQLDTARTRQILENRKNISSVIETIILCGQQNIPLRGHRDFGKLTVDSTDVNGGNVRNLLRYRARLYYQKLLKTQKIIFLKNQLKEIVKPDDLNGIIRLEIF